MSDAFRIPKEPAKVLICLPPDPPEPRLIFLSSSAEAHAGSETVSDLLLRPKRFLPLVEEGDGVSLIQKKALRWIRIEDPERDEWHYFERRAGAPASRVRLEFAHGNPLEGLVYAMTPPGEQRALDVVNLEEGFLHLEAAQGLFLVNLEHVTRIGVTEETHGDAR